MRAFVLCMSVVVGLASSQLSAVTVVPITFEELVAGANLIVYGRVNDVRGQWTSNRRAIDSVVTIEALEYFKNEAGPVVLMRLPGGRVSGMRHLMPGAPEVAVGDLVVLFLKSQGPALATPVGLNQGVFRVSRDPSAQALRVSPPVIKDSALGRVIRGAAARRQLSLSAFADAVREATQ